jgi:hypothetical protein
VEIPLLSPRSYLAVFALLTFATPLFAKESVKLTAVAVGLPGAKDANETRVAKFGTWVPVYATLEILGTVTESCELVIETPDADEVATAYTVPLDLASLAPGTKLNLGERGTLGYVRLASATSEVTVTVRTTAGAALSEPARVRVKPREPLNYIVLSIGGTPAGFELPKPPTASAEFGTLRAGRVELTSITEVSQLPDQWFGYDSADLVVFNTSENAPGFLKQLFASEEPAIQRKREALLEWVRRGGRLVLSIGSNAITAAQLPALKPLLPYAVKTDSPARTREVISLAWLAGSFNQANISNGALGIRGKQFPLANLAPQAGKPARVLIPPPGRQAEEPEPVAVQSAFGLGRVTVVGFDLDQSPFAEFAQRAEFWDFILRECGANRAASGGDGKLRTPGSMTEDEDEITTAIRSHNDTFEGVPVISFGWIAFLIGLYILLVGPLEYYFLKKILGRLELTWVTFPIIVLTVSAIAYFSASAVKGRELKVNKVDIVDVDAATNRSYGTSMFTIFSPRIDTYTIDLTPGSEWGERQPGTTATWYGSPRTGQASLTRRKYATRADGLDQVPIQVWSTKAFTANWSTKLNDSAIESTLTHPPGDTAKVIGTFRHNLPVPELTDCIAFYGGQAYSIPGDVILRGSRVRLVFDQSELATQWLQKKSQLEQLLTRVQSYAERPGQRNVQRQQLQQQVFSGPLPLTGMLFHEGSLRNDEGVIARNSSLRRLDQSWRLTQDNRDEVIILGRVSTPSGPADRVFTETNSPAILRFNNKPVWGSARQETWVRFYIPVR